VTDENETYSDWFSSPFIQCSPRTVTV